MNDSFVLKDVALLTNLHFNLLSVSQLLDEGLAVRFKKHASCILDSRGDLICNLLPYGRVFKADFSSSFGTSRCLLALLDVFWLLLLRIYGSGIGD